METLQVPDVYRSEISDIAKSRCIYSQARKSLAVPGGTSDAAWKWRRASGAIAQGVRATLTASTATDLMKHFSLTKELSKDQLMHEKFRNLLVMNELEGAVAERYKEAKTLAARFQDLEACLSPKEQLVAMDAIKRVLDQLEHVRRVLSDVAKDSHYLKDVDANLAKVRALCDAKTLKSQFRRAGRRLMFMQRVSAAGKGRSRKQGLKDSIRRAINKVSMVRAMLKPATSVTSVENEDDADKSPTGVMTVPNVAIVPVEGQAERADTPVQLLQQLQESEHNFLTRSKEMKQTAAEELKALSDSTVPDPPPVSPQSTTQSPKHSNPQRIPQRIPQAPPARFRQPARAPQVIHMAPAIEAPSAASQQLAARQFEFAAPGFEGKLDRQSLANHKTMLRTRMQQAQQQAQQLQQAMNEQERSARIGGSRSNAYSSSYFQPQLQPPKPPQQTFPAASPPSPLRWSQRGSPRSPRSGRSPPRLTERSPLASGAQEPWQKSEAWPPAGCPTPDRMQMPYASSFSSQASLAESGRTDAGPTGGWGFAEDEECGADVRRKSRDSRLGQVSTYPQPHQPHQPYQPQSHLADAASNQQRRHSNQGRFSSLSQSGRGQPKVAQSKPLGTSLADDKPTHAPDGTPCSEAYCSTIDYSGAAGLQDISESDHPEGVAQSNYVSPFSTAALPPKHAARSDAPDARGNSAVNGSVPADPHRDGQHAMRSAILQRQAQALKRAEQGQSPKIALPEQATKVTDEWRRQAGWTQALMTDLEALAAQPEDSSFAASAFLATVGFDRPQFLEGPSKIRTYAEMQAAKEQAASFIHSMEWDDLAGDPVKLLQVLDQMECATCFLEQLSIVDSCFSQAPLSLDLPDRGPDYDWKHHVGSLRRMRSTLPTSEQWTPLERASPKSAQSLDEMELTWTTSCSAPLQPRPDRLEWLSESHPSLHACRSQHAELAPKRRTLERTMQERQQRGMRTNCVRPEMNQMWNDYCQMVWKEDPKKMSFHPSHSLI